MAKTATFGNHGKQGNINTTMSNNIGTVLATFKTSGHKTPSEFFQQVLMTNRKQQLENRALFFACRDCLVCNVSP